jgi:hypothetical protein
MIFVTDRTIAMPVQVALGSITISGKDEIENRLIDCKPEKKKDSQYAQGQE